MARRRKGYEEVGGDGAGGGESAGVLNELMFSTTKNTDDMGQMTTFIGKRIIEFKSAKSLKKGDKHIYKFVVD